MITFGLACIGIYLLFYLCCQYFKYVLKFNISKLKYRPALLAVPCHALLMLYILIGQISILRDRARN